MTMTRTEIEEIIEDEIEVDAYDDDEISMGWHTYLDEEIIYPFEAIYTATSVSREKERHAVTVVGANPNYDYFNDRVLSLQVELKGLILPVDIQSLSDFDADDCTLRAIEVWKYNAK